MQSPLKNLLHEFSLQPTRTRAMDILEDCLLKKQSSVAVVLAAEFKRLFPNNDRVALGLIRAHHQKNDHLITFNLVNEFLDRYPNSQHYQKVVKLRNSIVENIKEINTSPQGTLNHDDNKPKLCAPLITLTMTTCKRLKLFIKTVDSFLNCCEDKHLISRYIVVDDNSSEEDRKVMQSRYPFMEFVFKSPDNKGHAHSMNLLRGMVKTPYVFHLEDDWLFFSKESYMTKCVEIIESDDSYGQCLINPNFMELPREEMYIRGGVCKQTSRGLKYLVHEFCPDQTTREEFDKKHGKGPSSNYWPHFSLRPGLTKRSVFENVGLFNPGASHFEMDYAYRYVASGWKTTFLDRVGCIHTGKHTSDRTGENAYTLNEEKQFGVLRRVPTTTTETKTTEPLVPPKPLPETPINDRYGVKPLVVTLKRRPSRLEKFVDLNKHVKANINVFEAVDGQLLNDSYQLQNMFEGNDFNMSSGIVGCALSHLRITIQLIQEQDKDCVYLVLEDDGIMVPDFDDKLKCVMDELKGKDWDLVYLGYHPTHRIPPYDENNPVGGRELIRAENSKEALEYSYGGTFGYLLNKQGAMKFLNFINTFGITNGIDTLQQKASSAMNVYYTRKPIITSEMCNGKQNADSDIQNWKGVFFGRSVDERVKEELAKFTDLVPIKNADDINDATREGKCYTLILTPDVSTNPAAISHFLQGIKQVRGYPCYNIGSRVFIVPNPSKSQLDTLAFERLGFNRQLNISSMFEGYPIKKLIFTNDWFVRNINISMKLVKEQLQNKLDKGIRVLEVGANEGRSTTWMLDELVSHSPDSRMVTIESYNPSVNGDVRHDTYDNFQFNITQSSEFRKHILIQSVPELSWDALSSVDKMLYQLEQSKPTRPFDLVYLNSSCQYTDVKGYLDELHKHELIGDLMVVNNVGFERRTEVYRALGEFLQAHPNQYKPILEEYQWVVKRT